MNFSFSISSDGIGKRALSGIVQTGLSQAIKVATQFVSVIVMSRILSPSEFGVVAMTVPIVAFVTLFQDMGIAQALVQKQSVTQQEASALFRVAAALGFAVMVLIIAIAPLAAMFYQEPRVGHLTAAMAALGPLAGLGTVHCAILNRKMQFGRLAIVETLSVVLGVVASVCFAWIYNSYWAIYVGALTSSVILNIGYWIVSGWLPTLFSKELGVGASLKFGANVTGFNVSNFLARNLDNVLIGRAWGEQPLGLYDRAYKLLLFPLQQINGPMSKVMLPTLARLVDNKEKYAKIYFSASSHILLVTLPGIVFMVGSASLLIPVLLGREWVGASPIFIALGIASLIQIFNNPSGWLFISQGRTREFLYWGVFGSITAIISFFIGLPYGPLGVAISYAAGEYIRTPILWWYVTRKGPINIGSVVALGLPHYFAAAVALIAVTRIFSAMVSVTPALALGGCLVASYIVYLAALCVFRDGRVLLRETLGLTSRLVFRRKVGI